ncbi:hypothetical protein ZIOFF_009667 [Zingiber officinale]|uniref:Phosphomannose isomerase type I catalytic domain-containing protein n=1 Tax=Zingiber officinale TaxID=94328 RepID=A0A8J5I325_ZINOF|nr:hypothetical protein ZIOFF_009667 [Zingiber officinale]
MLHMMQPHVYKDPDHKPEMVIALTEFKALCGFVSMDELKDVLIGVPRIAELVSNDAISKIICMTELNGYVNAKIVIQSIFTKLIEDIDSKEEIAGCHSSSAKRGDNCVVDQQFHLAAATGSGYNLL